MGATLVWNGITVPKAKPGSPVPRHSSRAARPWAAELLEPRRMLAAVPVADLELAPASSIPDWITDADGTVFFAGLSPGGEGRELWKTDGTAAGTTLVKDLLPGPGWSEPSTAYLNGKVFVLTDAPGRREVWVTDGTEAGTVLLTKANLDQGTQETSDSRLTPLGGFVYFWASDEEHGWEPLKSDGTPEGTMLVKDINPGPDRSGAYDGKFATFNGRIYFAARDAEDGAGSGLELWSTDGTEAGTARVKDINPGAASSYPQHFLVAGDNLFFDVS